MPCTRSPYGKILSLPATLSPAGSKNRVSKSSMPVSYTHLDVYKRQVAGRISEANFNLMLDKTQKEQAELKERVEQGRRKLADEIRLAVDLSLIHI